MSSVAARPNSSLSMLGKRLERLLFFGVFLLIGCVAEVYLSTASSQFVENREAAVLELLISRFESQKGSLVSEFELAKKVTQLRADRLKSSQARQERERQERKEAAAQAERRRRQSSDEADLRAKLGLPPLVESPRKATPIETPRNEDPDITLGGQLYDERVRSIVSEVADKAHSRPSAVETELSKELDPVSQLAVLRKRFEENERKRAKVWGIESPRILPFQYAGLDYRVPSDFLAIIVLIALAPLIIGWLGSFYITRQRELMTIVELEDYRHTFPHILNLVPVSFDRVFQRAGRERSIRERDRSRRANKQLLCFFRVLIILFFAAPMIIAFTYSYFTLFLVVDNEKWISFGIATLAMIVMFLQTVTLGYQEWIVLKGKEFFE